MAAISVVKDSSLPLMYFHQCASLMVINLTNSVWIFFMQTFNEFFIRELKPGARPIAYVGRDDIAICAADSRLMAFSTAEESLRFWIKVSLT